MYIKCRTLEDAELLHKSILNATRMHYVSILEALRMNSSNSYEEDNFVGLGSIYIYSHPSLVEIDPNISRRVEVTHILSVEKSFMHHAAIQWQLYEGTILDDFSRSCLRLRSSLEPNRALPSGSPAILDAPREVRERWRDIVPVRIEQEASLDSSPDQPVSVPIDVLERSLRLSARAWFRYDDLDAFFGGDEDDD